jgi:hypothetical protein
MNDMLDAELSKEEMKELLEFMSNHPFTKLCQLIQEMKAREDEEE